jgi:thioredoxin reductase (NADPH)
VNRKNGKTAGKLYDVTVVGGGVAGLAAAKTAGRLGLQVLLLEEIVFGGSVAVLERLEGYPGIEATGGWEFTQIMVKQAEAAGCLLRESIKVTGVRPETNSKFAILCSGKERFRSRSVIVCSGGSPRALGLQEEERFVRRGIHTCAQCAGGRYKGQDVAVAGNGSFSARAEAAMGLTLWAVPTSPPCWAMISCKQWRWRIWRLEGRGSWRLQLSLSTAP